MIAILTMTYAGIHNKIYKKPLCNSPFSLNNFSTKYHFHAYYNSVIIYYYVQDFSISLFDEKSTLRQFKT